VIATKECKVELSDHDHVVETIAWSTEKSIQSINDATGNDVNFFFYSGLNWQTLANNLLAAYLGDG